MKNKKIIVILAGLGLAFGLGYLLFRKPKPDDENKDDETAGGETSGGEASSGGTSSGGASSGGASSVGSSSGATSTALPTNPFKTEEEVKRFQSFARIYSAKPGWIGYPVNNPFYLGTSGVNKNGIDGKWGKLTAQAYKDYGEKFNTKILTTIPELTIQNIKNIVTKAKKAAGGAGCYWTEFALKNLYIYYYTDFPYKKEGYEVNFNNFLARFSGALDTVVTGGYPNPSEKVKNAFSYGLVAENGKYVPYKGIIYDAKYGVPIAYNVNDSNYNYYAIANKNNPIIMTGGYSEGSTSSYKSNDTLGKINGFFIVYTDKGAYYLYRFINSNFQERFVSASNINIEAYKAGSTTRLETYPARFKRDGSAPLYHPFKVYM